MPNVSDLLESVRRILGPRATEQPADEVYRQLATRGEHALAAEVAGLTVPPGRSVMRAMERNDVVAFTRALLADPYPQRYFGVDWGAESGPSHYTRRPPAKPPTSTTTIGEPAAIDAEYAALVADLGINSAAVDLERFKALVPELGLHVYDDDEVREYLHSLYKVPVGDLTSTVVWGWRPLRAIDRVPGAPAQYNGRVQRSVEPYTKPIPYPVLLTVKAVRDACPSARFYVSDEMQGEQIPDPFLLVEIAGQQFVIERWDEPAFRAKA